VEHGQGLRPTTAAMHSSTWSSGSRSSRRGSVEEIDRHVGVLLDELTTAITGFDTALRADHANHYPTH
jgi:hypothetical protein